MYSSIEKNKRNTIIIFALFIAVISGIGLLFSLANKEPSIFIFTLIGASVYALVEYFFASKIALSMSGAREVLRADFPEFYAAVDTISLTAGIPIPKVYVIDDPAPNAFAAGNSPEKSVVCATTGLLQIMDKSELEGVVAHEIAHIKNYDIRISMAAIALTSAIGFLADIAIRMAFGGRDRDESKGNILTIIAVIFAVISPILAFIIRMAISREREYLADATAVMLTRYPDGMINALQKLQQYSQPMIRQNTSTASLFISNPLKKGFFSGMFSTHPPLEDRIERLRKNSWKF